MKFQVRSSARATQRRRARVVSIVALVWALVCGIPERLGADPQGQPTPSRQATNRFRFQISDSVNSPPIPETTVSLVCWQKKESGLEKNEIEVKTDKNGMAEFPKLNADELAVTVNEKGSRSYWCWFRAERSGGLSRSKLEPWATALK